MINIQIENLKNVLTKINNELIIFQTFYIDSNEEI